jgi:hypothetical protein
LKPGSSDTLLDGAPHSRSVLGDGGSVKKRSQVVDSSHKQVPENFPIVLYILAGRSEHGRHECAKVKITRNIALSPVPSGGECGVACVGELQVAQSGRWGGNEGQAFLRKGLDCLYALGNQSHALGVAVREQGSCEAYAPRLIWVCGVR